MRSGPLRHRVTVQVRASAQDPSGEPRNEWQPFVTRWASVEPLVGREFFASQERNGRVQTRFRMRFVDGLKPAMRIIWQSRVFDITAVQQVRGLKAELVIMADELVEAAP